MFQLSDFMQSFNKVFNSNMSLCHTLLLNIYHLQKSHFYPCKKKDTHWDIPKHTQIYIPDNVLLTIYGHAFNVLK